MILMIDNYDSFTYNLYQAVGELYPDVKIFRNDKITVEEAAAMNPKAVIISPGPKYPEDAGVSMDMIKYFSGKVPVLGVCLGHQSIAQAFGGKIVKARQLMHGKSSNIKINTKYPVFMNLPDEIKAARYHSLIVDENSLPDCLEIIGRDECGQIMALKHKQHETYGLQFHPESILTDIGKNIIRNFISIADSTVCSPSENLSVKPKVELKPFIDKVVDGENLSENEASEAMNTIMSGNATDAQIASFLTALRIKGETIEEITGFAKSMRSKALKVYGCSDAIDIVGTGGDLAQSFNISTTSAFVISAAGVKVAKHGNRSVSSKSGAADVLEALGVKITTAPDTAKAIIDEIGMSFLFAQNYHSSMRYVGPARRETGIRTVFNILGPLCNPANTNYIVLGVYDKSLLEPIANVLKNIGLEKAMVVFGNDKLDEVSVSDKTSVCELSDGTIKSYDISPEDFGMPVYDKSEIVGGTAEDNAKITLGILDGTIKGAKRDIVVLNSACGLYTAGKVSSIAEGVKLAEEIIDGGCPFQKCVIDVSH